MYTITMSTAPMASGAIGVPPSTDSPIVRTRKNVPMSSVRYLFICLLLRVWRRQRSRDGSEPLVESRAPENARESVHRPPQLSASVHHAVHVGSQRLALHDADGARGKQNTPGNECFPLARGRSVRTRHHDHPCRRSRAKRVPRDTRAVTYMRICDCQRAVERAN